MKLRNKKTGEIVVFGEGIVDLRQIGCNNVAEMMDAGWEDYEEPKEFFAISPYKKEGYEVFPYDNFGHIYELAEELGIAFKTKDEAEKAVEKLKSWKRLKDNGFKFDVWYENHNNLGIIEFSFDKVENNVWDFEKDLDLLFGGEE